jgi:hypothetical protein
VPFEKHLNFPASYLRRIFQQKSVKKGYYREVIRGFRQINKNGDKHHLNVLSINMQKELEIILAKKTFVSLDYMM